ncbi:MAG: hypothetical protein MRY32_04235 [Rickettsiales bacterium]|nr:hypothetical protein [Rickettsiales bacterium]
MRSYILGLLLVLGIAAASNATVIKNALTFKKLSVAGQSDVVADKTNDTLTLAAGSNVTLTTNASTDTVTIAAGASSAYDTVAEEGSDLTQRDTINFVGGGITAADDAGNTRTNVTLDTDLNALAGVTSAADKVPYFTGSGTADVADLTTFGRSIIDDANEATFKATVNLEIGTDVQAYDSDLDTYAGITPSANVQTLLGAANYAAFKSSLSLDNVENTALSTWAGSSNITTLGTVTTGTWSAGAVTSTGTLAVGNGSTSAGVLQINEDSDDGSNNATFTVPALSADTDYTLPSDDGDAGDFLQSNGSGVLSWTTPIESLCFALSDETTDIETGTAVVTTRWPYAFTVTDVRASVNDASSSGTVTVDINDSGTTIMATNKLTIDATEETSETAATAAGITDSAFADDAEITFDIDGAGTDTKGLKVCIIGRQ